MPVSIDCPGCGKTLKATEKHVGKRAKCPRCGETVVITASGLVIVSDVEIQDDPPSTDAESKPLPPTVNERVPAPAIVIESPKAAERVTCPFCGEEIAETAIKCRFCNEFLDGRPREQPQSWQQVTVAPHVVPQPKINVVVNQPRQQWNPVVAMFLSFVIPGLGQIYKGQLVNGIVWFILVVIGYVLLIIPGLILHFLCVVGAGLRKSGSQTVLAIVGVVAAIIILNMNSGDDQPQVGEEIVGKEGTPNDPNTTSEENPKSTAIVFDVASLVGKSIDDIRTILGTPEDSDVEPTKLQLDVGFDMWNNIFIKDKQELLVTFNPLTRRVIDFFLIGEDESLLLQQGNLVRGSSNYRIEPVKKFRNPSEITGIKIIPNKKQSRPSSLAVSAKEQVERDSKSARKIEPSKSKTKSKETSDATEKRAANKLTLAKVLLRKDSPVAKRRLQEVIDDFPGTKVAKEAAELLAK